MTEREQIQSAMQFLDSDSREDWIKVGMAVKSALGDGGKDIWFSWSAQSDKFRPRDAETAWRSFKEGGGIGIGTLFKMAKEAGWQGSKWESTPEPRPKRTAPPVDYAKQHAVAAERAGKIVATTVWGPSAYLLNKGFEDAYACGLKQGEDLIIPMRDYWNGKLMAVQRITPAGDKKYQPAGCRVSETCYVINKQLHPQVQWWCEGYATGVALMKVLKDGYRHHDQVVVCFSAHNLRKLAGHPARSRYYIKDIVVADNDWWRCKNGHRFDGKKEPAFLCAKCGAPVVRPTGQTAAAATRCQVWMPGDPGMDACDVLREAGPEALQWALIETYSPAAKNRRARLR